ncbi:MAG: alanine--tRNA ligase [Acidobacteriota bacterium]
MNSREIRQSFIDFFAERGHRLYPSAPLVPHGDPTLLFTNAGMVQFKDYFLGTDTPAGKRAVSSQRCLRVSGKHNDLENVGPSPRHHTFFEMLGNFSFGDYFKEDAIRFAWDLVTRVWGLDPRVLSATVYEEDDEAFALWTKLSTLPEGRIHRCGKKDNFWAMGDTGPCGPCSEIFVDLTPHLPEVGWDEGTDSGRYLEIWNLVFMQYERSADGTLVPLPNPSIDTGAGLERVSAVIEGVASNYDTDLFQPILRATAELAHRKYGVDAGADTSMRVVADHLRAVSFLLADGVIPGNEGRGYVLRRLLRRAVRHGMRLGFEEPFLNRLVPVLGEVMGSAYPELGATEQASRATIRAEEEKFLDTVATASQRVQEAIEEAKKNGGKTLSGETVFRFYDTYGLHVDLIREIAEEERFAVDDVGFELALEEQRSRSREATGDTQKRHGAMKELMRSPYMTLNPTEFLGYGETEAKAQVERIVVEDPNAGVDFGVLPAEKALTAGHRGLLVLNRTTFYAESGGEIGDTGRIVGPTGEARVIDTQKESPGVFFHYVEVERGEFRRGDEVTLAVDAERRAAIQRNHTATHLLHAALHRVVGEGARQAGSLVAPDRLRFDFTHGQPVVAHEKRRIEDLVNEWVRAATPTQIGERSYKEALADGAMALFGEKYGDRVRTVAVPPVSLELCGGCHVRNTGEIGLFVITSEKGIASGVRRIEALTGAGALAWVRERESLLAGVESALHVPAERAPSEIAALRERLKDTERQLSGMRLKLASGGGASNEGTEAGRALVEGVQIVVREVPAAPANELRSIADALRTKLGSGVVVLGTREEGKVTLLVAVTSDTVGRVKAGDLVKRLAPIVGGSGGGKADFAQAGGKDPARLDEALAAVPEAIRALITG